MASGLGAVVGALGFILLAVAALVYASGLRRGKAYEAAMETATVQRSRAEAYKAQSDERLDAMNRLTHRVSELEGLLLREQEKKDIAPILEKLVEQADLSAERQEAIMRGFAGHEERAMARQEAILGTLQAIADGVNRT